jgi:hypothetical protein
MKYVCLVYCDEVLLSQVHDAECAEFERELDHARRRIAAEALQPAETATTVRVRNGRISVTDGPFAETKEQLAGFYLIDAGDLNDAIRIAGGIPVGRVGSIEIRPIRQLGV